MWTAACDSIDTSCVVTTDIDMFWAIFSTCECRTNLYTIPAPAPKRDCRSASRASSAWCCHRRLAAPGRQEVLAHSSPQGAAVPHHHAHTPPARALSSTEQIEGTAFVRAVPRPSGTNEDV